MVGMKGAGRYPVTWSDTKACWRTKMRFRGKGSSSADRFQPIKRHVQGGKELVFVLEEGASKERKECREHKELGHECESMVGKWGKKGCLERMQGGAVCWRGKREWGVRLSVQRYGGCDFGCFCGECWGGGAAMKGLSCFFIVVTMVYVMLSFLGGRELCGGLGDFF